jgi:dihydroorotate dehydrogenase
MLYRSVVRPVLFKFSAERAHALAVTGLRLSWGLPAVRSIARSYNTGHDPRLAQTLWGLPFEHPVGLAAGFDKNAQYLKPLAALGFSHVEAGTITGQGQPGNPQPRLFRLVEDQAVINRMGFNNAGAAPVAARLQRQYDHAGGRRRPAGILGINLGKTKVVDLAEAVDDYVVSVHALAPFADYMVVNVSSPNTPGLRDLQAESSLRPLLEGVRQALDEVRPSGCPLLLKIAPDLCDAGIDSAVDVALETKCDGIIASNTTIGRNGLHTPQARVDDIGVGGLSGKPVRELSLKVLRHVAKRVDQRVPIIGVGGIDSAEVAWEKIGAGASLVQVYTGMIFQGPGMIRHIVRGLSQRLDEVGLPDIASAVGRDL